MNNFFKSNLFSNMIIAVLLLSNIFLTFQFISTNKELQQVKNQDSTSARAQSTEILKLFLDVVLNTRGTPSDDDRIKLENSIRQMKDPVITKAWEELVSSKDPKISQKKALEFLGLLEDRMESKENI